MSEFLGHQVLNEVKILCQHTNSNVNQVSKLYGTHVERLLYDFCCVSESEIWTLETLRNVYALLDSILGQMSQDQGHAQFAATVVTTSALFNLLYRKGRVLSRELEVESQHLRVVRKLLSLKHFAIAHTHLFSVLANMNLLPSKYRPSEISLGSGANSETSARYISLAVGCWLSMFITVSELDVSSDEYLQSKLLLIECLDDIHYWIENSNQAEKYNATVFRYALRLLKQVTDRQAEDMSVCASPHDFTADKLCFFVVKSYIKSNCTDQLPHLVQTIAQLTTFETFKTMWCSIRGKVLSFEVSSWIDVIDKLACFGYEEKHNFTMVSVISLMMDTLEPAKDEFILLQMIFMRLVLHGMSDTSGVGSVSSARGATDVNDVRAPLLKHCLERISTSTFIAVKEPLKSTRYWRCARLLASEIFDYARSLPVREKDGRSQGINCILFRIVRWLMELIQTLLPCSRFEDKASTKILHAAISKLVHGYILLQPNQFDLSLLQHTRKHFSSLIKTYYELYDGEELLRLEHSLEKLAKEFAGQGNRLLTMNALNATVVFSSSRAVFHGDDTNINRFSVRLMAFSDFNLQHDQKTVAFLHLTEGLVSYRSFPRIRGVYNTEIVRCLCTVSISGRQDLCLTRLLIDSKLDGEIGVDWSDLYAEHYSVWSEVNSFANARQEYETISSCLSTILADIKLLPDTRNISNVQVLVQLFNSLSSILRQQFQGSVCCESWSRPTLEILQSACNTLIGSVFPKNEHMDLFLRVRQTEIAAHVLLSFANGDDINSRPVLNLKHEFEIFSEMFKENVAKFDKISSRHVTCPSLLNEIKCGFTDTLFVLETTHMKFCLLDQIVVAASLADTVHSIVGIKFHTNSFCCAALLTKNMCAQSTDVVDHDSSNNSWQRSESVLSLYFREQFDCARCCYSTGKLFEGFTVIETLLLQIKLALKSRHICFAQRDSSLLETVDSTYFLQYKNKNTMYEINVWCLMAMYIQGLYFRALISSSLGLLKPSRSTIDEVIHLCKRLRLLNLSVVMRLQYNCHIADLTMDAFKATHVVLGDENIQYDEGIHAHLLQEATRISVYSVQLAVDYSENSAYTNDLYEKSLTATLSLMTRLRGCKEVNTTPWLDWCYSVLSRLTLRHSLFVPVSQADDLIARGAQWRKRIINQSVLDDTLLLKVRSIVNIRRLYSQQASTSSQEFTTTCDEVHRLLRAGFEISVQSPMYIRTIALLFASFGLLSGPEKTNLTVSAIHVASGVNYKQKEMMSLLCKSRTSDDGEDKIASCIKLFDSVIADTHSGFPSESEIWPPTVYPMITLCPSPLAAHLRSEVETVREILLIRSSTFVDEPAIMIKLPWTLSSYPSELCPVEALRGILGTKPDKILRSGNTSREGKIAWWEHRIAQDAQLEDLVQFLQRQVLGCWWFLLMGEPPAEASHVYSCASGELLEQLCEISVAYNIAIPSFARHMFRLLLQNGLKLSLEQIESVIDGMCVSDKFPSERCKKNRTDDTVYQHAIRQLAIHCHRLSKNIAECCFNDASCGPVLLLFDGDLHEIPWESMSVLAQQRLYRIPCKSFALKDSVQESDVHSCIDVSHAFAILNPSGDLLNTEETLLPLLQRNKTCTIVRGTPPRDMCTAMTLYDILLFFGHGNAQEYLPPSSVWIGWRAVMILMGCSSGALVSQEDIGLDGIVFSYLLAGTPSVVANLWDVTDKDIDRFSSALVGAWFKHADLPVYSTLSSSVSLARTQCQLQFLTGAAPVVYGLPVSLRNSN